MAINTAKHNFFDMGLLAVLAGAALLVGCTPQNKTLVPLNATILANPPQYIALNINKYNPQPGNTLQNIFVSNFSVVAKAGNIQYSTARDGLTDSIKNSNGLTYGFNINSPESAVIGFADLVLFVSGVVAGQQSTLNCPVNQQASSANDAFTYTDSRFGGVLAFLGLRDCDKTYIGISSKTFDSNNNGIPDYLELRCGLNPINKTQAFISTAGDSLSNLEKCRRNIPVTENSQSQANQVLAYQYSNQRNQNGSLNFIVNNIPILNGGQDNFIALYVVEANSNTKATSLYTAFLLLPAGYANDVLSFDYWATAPANFTNTQITSITSRPIK